MHILALQHDQAAEPAFLHRLSVPFDNNPAERSVRSLIIARKVSGDTRSPHGSTTRMALFSLFGSRVAQELNPFFYCLAPLSQAHPLRSTVNTSAGQSNFL